MTASEVVSGWPDKATVELVTTAISQTRGVLDIDTDDIPDNQWRTLARAALKVLPNPTADTVQQALVRDDAVWMAKLARGSSWPGEMAHNVEQAANRVIAAYGSDADRAAIAALLAGGGE
jgi:hypothetical protein